MSDAAARLPVGPSGQVSQPLWPTDAEWRVIESGFRAGVSGFSQRDIDWQENCHRPTTPEEMALDIAYVILNSGMKYSVAIRIWPRIRHAIEMENKIPFGHVGKVSAMSEVWERRRNLFAALGRLPDDAVLDFCRALPWIGPITCYHLAKNWGLQVAKPDVWLQRVADRTGETPQQLCERISAMCGLKVPTVDLIIWASLQSGVLSIGDVRPAVATQAEGRPAGPSDQNNPTISGIRESV